jgi:uncharacterized protein (TIGR03437 family)
MNLWTTLLISLSLSHVCYGSQGLKTSILGNAVKAAAAVNPQAVYGVDNREEIYSQSKDWQEISKSVLAVVPSQKLFQSQDSAYFDYTKETLVQSHKVCSDQKYANQFTLPKCSAFLIAPDLIVTAYHCVKTQQDCENLKFVTDFKLDNPSQSGPDRIYANQVYSCKQIVTQKFIQNEVDLTVIKIDRPICDRSSLNLNPSGEVSAGAPVKVIGFPSGVPMKLASGASIRSSDSISFKANLDTFGGNSGSPVINDFTKKVEGVLVRGETDYTLKNGCNVVTTFPDDGGRGETSIKSREILDILPFSLANYSANFCRNNEVEVTHFNSANYSRILAPGVLATVKGESIWEASAEAVVDCTLPLEQRSKSCRGRAAVTEVDGTYIKINGAQAEMFYLSQNQINYLVPNHIQPGKVSIELYRKDRLISTQKDVTIHLTSPGFFTLFSMGSDGYLLGASYQNSQRMDLVQKVSRQGMVATEPFAVAKSQPGNPTVLELYLTGMKNNLGPSNYQVLIGGENSRITYLGSHTSFVGLDQINLEIPMNLDFEGQTVKEFEVEIINENQVRTKAGSILVHQ